MTTEILLAILAFGTMGAVTAFAWRSARATEARRHKPTQRSTLAADGPNALSDGRRPPDT